MERRNPRLFRRIEQLIAEGAEYQAATVIAFSEEMGHLFDRADDLRKREREER